VEIIKTSQWRSLLRCSLQLSSFLLQSSLPACAPTGTSCFFKSRSSLRWTALQTLLKHPSASPPVNNWSPPASAATLLISNVTFCHPLYHIPHHFYAFILDTIGQRYVDNGLIVTMVSFRREKGEYARQSLKPGNLKNIFRETLLFDDDLKESRLKRRSAGRLHSWCTMAVFSLDNCNLFFCYNNRAASTNRDTKTALIAFNPDNFGHFQPIKYASV